MGPDFGTLVENGYRTPTIDRTSLTLRKVDFLVWSRPGAPPIMRFDPAGVAQW